MVTIKRNCLDAETFRSLTESAGWGKPPVEQVETALAHSFVTVCAYENGQAVGMARMLGDGALSYFVKDVVVRPDCQQRGIGRQLMEELMNYSRTISSQLESIRGADERKRKRAVHMRSWGLNRVHRSMAAAACFCF